MAPSRLSSHDDLLPFFTYNDLYLKPIYKVNITVNLPKLRQMGQSVSNWEIRERLKKMLNSVELSDFKVLESSLEEVQFAAVVNNVHDSRTVMKTLDGVSFRAIGFSEPLTVNVTKGKLEFPTRVEWDKFFAESREMNEQNAGERPDTIYIGGLPFEWFKGSISDSYEDVLKKIFNEFGEVSHVDIPQCDPLRKEMDAEISGIRQSVWSFGQDTFFEAYVQFKEYAGFLRAISALSGKVLAQKIANGQLREAKLKVDFDRTAHLSARKIRQRDLRRACLEYGAECARNAPAEKKPAGSIMELVSSTSNATVAAKSAEKSSSTTSKKLPPPPAPPSLSPRKSWRGDADSKKLPRRKSRFSDVKDEDECELGVGTSQHHFGQDQQGAEPSRWSGAGDGIEEKRQSAEMTLTRQLIRAEKRRKTEEQKSREHKLRKKLKHKLTERLNCTKLERETGAKALLKYIAKLHEARTAALRQMSLSVNELASEYVKEQGLPNEDALREQLLRKRELKLRSQIAERMLNG